MTRDEKKARLVEVEAAIEETREQIPLLIAELDANKAAVETGKAALKAEQSKQVDLISEQLRLLRGLR